MKRQFLRGAAACLLAIPVSQGAAQQILAVGDPLELFAELMPVFSHARCANCHGGVDPHAESGPLANTHDGGIIPAGGTCADSGCHERTDDGNDETKWQTAAPHHSFGGKSAKELCDMQSPIARRMRPPKNYIRHLEKDFLIDLAFGGESGGANTVSPVPPPMRKPDFLKAARAWLAAGAGCETWEGTITQTESFVSNYGFPIAGGTHSVTESARRVVKLNRNNAAATAKIETTGHAVQQLVSHSGGCTTTITNKQEWSDKAFAGLKPAVIRFEIAPDGSYLIRFKGPPEKTHTTDFGTHISSCGSLPQPLPGGANLDWDPWKFSIRCPPTPVINTERGESIDCNGFDAEKSPRLKGEMTRVIVDHWDAAERQSWLTVSPAGISRADTGESLPVTVFTEWNFVLVE